MSFESPSLHIDQDERSRLLSNPQAESMKVYTEQPEDQVYVAGSGDANEELANGRGGVITAETGGLHRKLSARQVQMIAIGEFATLYNE